MSAGLARMVVASLALADACVLELEFEGLEEEEVPVWLDAIFACGRGLGGGGMAFGMSSCLVVGENSGLREGDLACDN